MTSTITLSKKKYYERQIHNSSSSSRTNPLTNTGDHPGYCDFIYGGTKQSPFRYLEPSSKIF